MSPAGIKPHNRQAKSPLQREGKYRGKLAFPWRHAVQYYRAFSLAEFTKLYPVRTAPHDLPRNDDLFAARPWQNCSRAVCISHSQNQRYCGWTTCTPPKNAKKKMCVVLWCKGEIQPQHGTPEQKYLSPKPLDFGPPTCLKNQSLSVHQAVSHYPDTGASSPEPRASFGDSVASSC